MGAVAANGAGIVHGPFWAAAAGFASTGGTAHAGLLSREPGWMERVEPPRGVILLPRIKLVVMIARLPTITSDQFHEYWLTQHAALALEVADAIKLRRYVQSHQIPSPAAAGFANSRGWEPSIFEGIMEGWWNSEAEMQEAFSTSEGMEIARRVMEDERRFSSDRCVGIITREYLIHDADEKPR